MISVTVVVADLYPPVFYIYGQRLNVLARSTEYNENYEADTPDRLPKYERMWYAGSSPLHISILCFNFTILFAEQCYSRYL